MDAVTRQSQMRLQTHCLLCIGSAMKCIVQSLWCQMHSGTSGLHGLIHNRTGNESARFQAIDADKENEEKEVCFLDVAI